MGLSETHSRHFLQEEDDAKREELYEGSKEQKDSPFSETATTEVYADPLRFRGPGSAICTRGLHLWSFLQRHLLYSKGFPGGSVGK